MNITIEKHVIYMHLLATSVVFFKILEMTRLSENASVDVV